MGETNLDLRLNKAQMDALSKSLKGLMDYVSEHDPQYKTVQGRIKFQWQRYLVNALKEAVHVAKGQKTRTAGKRHEMLEQVEAYLGHYPTEADVRAALSDGGAPDESLVKIIAADVQRLKVRPLPPPRRSSIDVMEEKIRKLTGKGTKRPRKR